MPDLSRKASTSKHTTRPVLSNSATNYLRVVPSMCQPCGTNAKAEAQLTDTVATCHSGSTKAYGRALPRCQGSESRSTKCKCRNIHQTSTLTNIGAVKTAATAKPKEKRVICNMGPQT